jgi:hypothetical protein
MFPTPVLLDSGLAGKPAPRNDRLLNFFTSSNAEI